RRRRQAPTSLARAVAAGAGLCARVRRAAPQTPTRPAARRLRNRRAPRPASRSRPASVAPPAPPEAGAAHPAGAAFQRRVQAALARRLHERGEPLDVAEAHVVADAEDAARRARTGTAGTGPQPRRERGDLEAQVVVVQDALPAMYLQREAEHEQAENGGEDGGEDGERVPDHAST